MASHPTLPLSTNPPFKVPINCTPRMFEDLGDDSTLRPLHRALEECASIAREIVSHRDNTLKQPDPNLSDAGQQHRIREHSEPALIGANKILTAALAKADASVEKMEAELDRVLPALEEGDHGAEIRQHIKVLPDRERRAFVLRAQETDDTTTIASVLGAPAYLSGLTDADMALVRERRAEAAAKAKPGLAKRLDQLRTARSRVEQARASLHAERLRAFGGSHPAAA